MDYGAHHGCAIVRDGAVHRWAEEPAELGQLGDGVEPFSRVPVRMRPRGRLAARE